MLAGRPTLLLALALEGLQGGTRQELLDILYHVLEKHDEVHAAKLVRSA